MRTRSDISSILRSLSRPIATAGVVLASAAVLAAPAAAQGRYGRGGYGSGGYDYGGGYGNTGARPLYTWNGRVDRQAYIVMQNGDVRTQIDGDDNGAGGRVRVASALPQVDGVLDVRLQEGRGRVDVIEQPTRRNGYRAVVRVRDGDDRNGGYDRQGRDRDRDRNGGYDNGSAGNTDTYGSGTYGNGGSGVLHWRGRVDNVEDIRLQGNRVDTRTVSGGGASGVRSQISGGLPASDVTVRVNDRSGRGRVAVVQQPRAWNGYTAVVRVEDRDAGAAWYDFDVTW